MTIDEMKKMLEAALKYKRYTHSLAVYDTARELAKYHDADLEKVSVAALLHDCGREIPIKSNLDKAKEVGITIDFIEANQPILLHAKLGAYLAKHKYGVTDEEVLTAIAQHSTGAPQMSKTAMIVYLADLLEPSRGFFGIDEMRVLAKKDLEKTMVKAYALTIKYLLDQNLLIHPDCIYGLNELQVKFKNAAKSLR
ncbi:MAG TPA: bis(5'-nucleosyl)-tetraphosphatase (symmetrical) YqeK [Candidatus Avacidaminococcus intestinavium]|uniref:bis(5'-nucleosyl)-tetraphosphatase (symmetrical) n=1 Tax=Candidatus Avacidaminococcus intestinavium TaxID=2840684 RepID=A0A9D1MR75_9FIRM|nr:bis(5'-nucleosyl)-tetraphosphatase (symmetrical) YqeK [Candidatus Avacidaminococcus intestinavium]